MYVYICIYVYNIISQSELINFHRNVIYFIDSNINLFTYIVHHIRYDPFGFLLIFYFIVKYNRFVPKLFSLT